VKTDTLDFVRSIYARWSRGEFGAIDWAHPDIEFVMADGPTPGRWTGVDAMGASWGALIESFEDFHVEAEEIRALDPGRFLVFTRNTGRGRASGVEIGGVTARGANVLHVQEGRVVRLVLYWDRERALAELAS
jgi:ketosteroid isomerase-like protein